MIDGFIRIFEAYGGMDESVQETIQTLITPLIRALGPSHGKLLTLLRTFPPRSASLALRVLNIFTEVGRPSAQLVALIKALTNERELDARFLIPIIAEMDKVCRSHFVILYLVHLGLMCRCNNRRISCGISQKWCLFSMGNPNRKVSFVRCSVQLLRHLRNPSVAFRPTYLEYGRVNSLHLPNLWFSSMNRKKRLG